MKKNIFLPFILALFVFKTYAQNTYAPGYIVKAQGDTVKGFILTAGIESLEQVCSFKTTGNAEPIKYLPSDLKGFEITGFGRFEALDLKPENAEPQGQIFASVIVKGYSSLYAYKDGLFYTTAAQKTYKLEIKKKTFTKEGRTFEQIQPAYKGILSSLMNDCEKVKGRINKVALEVKPLAALVNTYNSCFSDSKSEIVKNKTFGYDLYAGAFISASNYSYNYQNYYATYINFEQLLENKTRILPTLSFKVISRRSNLGFEINFLAVYNNEFKSELVGANGFTYYTKFKYNAIQIPISLSYNFRMGSFSPFVEIGANQILVTPKNNNGEADLIAVNRSNQSTTTLQGDYLVGEKSYIKPLVGIGTSYQLSNKLSLIVRARMEFGKSALFGYTDLTTNGVVNFNHYEIKSSNGGVALPKEYVRESVISGTIGLTWKL